MTTKMTKKTALETLLTLDEVRANPALVEFAQNELDLLARKAEAAKKETEKKADGDRAVKTLILNVLSSVGKPTQIKDLLKANPSLLDVGTGKVQYLLNQMVKEGLAAKTVDKRIALFSAVERG